MFKIVTLLFIITVALSHHLVAGATIPVAPGSTLSAALASSSNGDILQLQAGTYTITSEVSLSDGGTRTIVGASSQSTILTPSSSNPYARFITLSSGSVILQDLKLTGFQCDSSVSNTASLAGNIINVQGGTLQITSCECTNNNAFEQDGGVVAATGSSPKTIRIADTAFSQNSAGLGSAVALSGNGDSAQLQVSSCSFDGHNNIGHGVLYANGLSNAVVSVQDSSFSNNVGSDRGALVIEGGSVNVQGTYFANNLADSGSALGLIDCQASFQNCTFYANLARAGGGAVRQSGDGVTTFTKCVFLNNQAKNQAGAVELDQPFWTLTDCYFEGNFAPVGGAFQLPESANSGNVADNVVTGCTFVNNYGSSIGGAIMSAAGFSIFNTTFVNNSAGDGGGIYQYRSQLFLQDVTFLGNTARSGGAVYLNNDPSVSSNFAGTIDVFNNKASTLGGGFYISGNSSVVLPGASIVIDGNTASLGGGVALVDLVSFDILSDGQMNILNNRASYGAGLYLDDQSYMNCPRVSNPLLLTLSNNIASTAGGAIYYASNSLNDVCPRINATFLGQNTAPYGSLEGSLPSSIFWTTTAPTNIRIGEHFSQSGQLLDIFSEPIRSASSLISFQMSIVASNNTPIEQLAFVELDGLVTTAPRDLDGSLQFKPFVVGQSAVNLPLSMSLAVISRPLSLPPQYFSVELTSCTGGYVTYVDAGEVFCLELISASDWARAVSGAVAGVGIVCIGFMWLLLFIKPQQMVHFGRTASPVCLHAVCFGSILVLISIFAWMEDNDSNCVARPWIAIFGLTIMLSGFFVISFSDFLRARKAEISDAIVLVIVLALSLIANLIVLIIWTVEDPYELLQIVGTNENTLTEYCYSSDTTYIWILVGFYAGFGALYLLSLFLQRNLPFNHRQSKHFSLYSIQAAAISIALIPVAAVYFTSLDVFFLVVTLGLAAVAILPAVPLLGLRAYRAFKPMDGDRLTEHVEWLIRDHSQRTMQVTQITSGTGLSTRGTTGTTGTTSGTTGPIARSGSGSSR